jgi:hypothetical protein
MSRASCFNAKILGACVRATPRPDMGVMIRASANIAPPARPDRAVISRLKANRWHYR